jgi:hypothetical protein
LRPCGETEERRSMKTLLVGAVGVLALQALLVLGYLAVNRQDAIILNPDKGNLNENGIAMVMTCGEGSGSGVLDKVPPNGEDAGPWTRGRTVQGDCNIYYYHNTLYHACFHSPPALGPCRRDRGMFD